jgi:hypothetical protein
VKPADQAHVSAVTDDAPQPARTLERAAVDELGAVSALPADASAATGADLSHALRVSIARRMMVS